MGDVLLVQVDPGLLAQEASRPRGLRDAHFESARPDEVLQRLEPSGRFDALVLGSALPDPIRVAQDAHSVDRDIAVIVLAEAARRAELVKTLQFVPMLRGDVRCVTGLDAWEFLHDLEEAVELTRRRRRHRQMIQSLNAQVANIRPARASEVESLGQLLDLAPVGVAALDPAGVVSAWNRRAERIFDRPAASVVGRPFVALLPPSEHPKWESLAARANSHDAPARIEVERQRQDDVPQQLEITAAPLMTGSEAAGLMLIFQDLTERVAAEQERAELLKQTQVALAVRDEFLSVASHELRTPLTSLRLVIQSMGRDVLTADLPAHVRAQLERKVSAADRQAVRLTRLVEGLLDVSSIQSGRLRLERAVVDLPEVVETVVAELDDQFERAGCEPILRLERPVKGPWDARRLEQVVMNLVSNALRYAPGTPIEIDVHTHDHRAVLEVADHGIGIDPTDLDRIFARFERAAPSRNYGGLGLGLFISRKIVEAHGGTITARSTPGAGATFRVELPFTIA